MLQAAATITDFYRYSNYAEAGLWLLVAGVSLKAAIDRGHHRAGWLLFVTLIAFGLSDVVETTTGAWWRPWWLFVWKAACVAIIVVTVGRLWWVTRRRAPTSPGRSAEA